MSFHDAQLRARKIALIGYAETSWPSDEVWADRDVEKWTLNHGHNIHPNWDRLFEFHSRDVIEGESKLHFRGVDQWAALKAVTDKPIYMKSVEPEIPCSVEFPIDSFTRFFGALCEKLAKQPYVEMAAGYMIGHAIMMLSDLDSFGREIYVYGFELFDGEEYAHQRACFEFYAGWAMGAGIKLTVPNGSAIFHSRGLYEYETGEKHQMLNLGIKYLDARFSEMKRKFAEAKERNDVAVGEMQTISGVMQEVEQEKKFLTHLLRGGSYT